MTQTQPTSTKQNIKNFLKVLFCLWKILLLGLKKHKGYESFLAVYQSLNFHLESFLISLQALLHEMQGSEELRSFGELTEHSLNKLKASSAGLHSLLPNDPTFSYSLIIPVDNPFLAHFKMALHSALDQTAPNMEVLIGLNGEQTQEIKDLCHGLETQYPEKLKIISLPKSFQIHVINTLAKQAKGNYLVFAEDDGWMRPDLLFRFEQTLRILPSKNNIVLYSDEYTLQKGSLKPGHPFSWPSEMYFPYLFTTRIPNCFLISTSLWQTVNGLQETMGNMSFYDLFLRANLAQAKFHKIPFRLFATREKQISKADYLASIQSLSNYAEKKNLPWKVSEGFRSDCLKVSPRSNQNYSIHVIILYKNLKTMTLAAVRSILKQKNVTVKITAVDNRSDDLTIRSELETWGVEVLPIDEPFNFSRLNNLAVKKTEIGKDCELVFFMNNDVEMHGEALWEMSQWVDQPHIGLVGCRLHYPDNTLQCGGVDMSKTERCFRQGWDLTESKMPFDQLILQKTLRVVDSVSGAACLMKKSDFIKIGGFDEIWYPISYSDTNLSIKLKAINLWTFYTPFAWGTHHESKTRYTNHAIEDYESSMWLHQLYQQVKPFKPLEL